MMPTEKTGQVAKRALWALASFSLVYYVWIMGDLITHPFLAGANAGTGIPFLFRWLSGIAGTLDIIVALLIVRRVPENPIGRLLICWGTASAGWSIRVVWPTMATTEMVQAIYSLYFFVIVAPIIVLLLYLFPTGDMVPRRAAPVYWGMIVWMALTGLVGLLGTPEAEGVGNPIFVPLLAAVGPWAGKFQFLPPMLAAFFSMTFRYRTAGDRVRLQIKWLLWCTGVAAAIVLLTSFIPVAAVYSVLGVQGAESIQVGMFIFWQAFPAVAIGVAILRHRLWDIDVIIRRTVTYAVITGLLAAVYFGVVTLLQSAFSGMIGSKSPLAVVISTLAIAALFTPVRRRVQGFVDRRFNRRRYNAEQTLEAFAEAMRDDVELDHLSAALVGVVEETMQPESVALWLNKSQSS